MMQIESRQLRQLVTLARSGSFPAAARRLSLTEPALLRNVQTLERELGLRLFHRRRGGIALTPAGEIVVGRAQLVVDGLENLRRDVVHADSVRRATMRIGAAVVPGIRLLPDAIARFGTAMPRVRIDVLVGDAGAFLRALLREEIDCFIGDCTDALADPRFEVVRLEPEPAVWVCRDGHPLAGEGLIDLAALARYPLAVPTLPRRARPLLDAIGPRAVVRCDDLVLLRRLVLAGETVGILPHAFAAADVAGGALRELAVESAAFVTEIGVALRIGTRAAQPLASLLEAIRAADLGGPVPRGEPSAPRPPSPRDPERRAERGPSRASGGPRRRER
jgi:DNA-binding transcriptional LysR family regulator